MAVRCWSTKLALVTVIPGLHCDVSTKEAISPIGLLIRGLRAWPPLVTIAKAAFEFMYIAFKWALQMRCRKILEMPHEFQKFQARISAAASNPPKPHTTGKTSNVEFGDCSAVVHLQCQNDAGKNLTLSLPKTIIALDSVNSIRLIAMQ
jgi:hypothetical protein